MPAQATTTGGPHPPDAEVAQEWARRAERTGLARVMRASQPAGINETVTAKTRHLVADYLLRAAADLHRPVESALEVGCGAGRLTPTLARRARRVTAVDMTAAMLDSARAACTGLGNVSFVHAAAEELPWHGKVHDIAVSVWVLMHLLDEAQLARVCASLAESSRYILLVEYTEARIPVSSWSRLRSRDDYLALFGGGDIVEERVLDYGGDRSTALLFRPHGVTGRAAE